MNDIPVSLNKFNYDQSKLPAPIDGNNYFGLPYASRVTGSKHFTVKGHSINNSVVSIPQSQYVVFHVRGYITKPLTSSVAYYSIVNIDDTRDNGILVPSNPYTTIDTFDYMYVRPYNNHARKVFNAGVYCYDNTDTIVNDNFTCDITVDIMSL